MNCRLLSVRLSEQWQLDLHDRVPTAQGKQGKIAKKIFEKILVRNQRGFGNFDKTQLAQVVNSLILKIQDIAIFAAKYSNYSKSVSPM